MTRKIYDLAVKTDTYRDRDGNEKGRWQNVGAVLEFNDGGRAILLDRWFNPAGVPNPDNRPNVMISMFEPKGDRPNDSRDSRASKPATETAPDDDIPF